MDWRLIATIVLIVLSVVDLSLTGYYVQKYKKWQPDKPYKLIERNPLLVFLWNTMGLWIGLLVGGVIILSLMFIVGKSAHWLVILLLLCFLIWAMFNHYTNINLLHQLIEKYPSGYLPTEIFGKVVGNKIK